MEVASCDADHKGEWKGEWEECEVLADHGDTCNVRIVEDGQLCFGVPRRMVRQRRPRRPRRPSAKAVAAAVAAAEAAVAVPEVAVAEVEVIDAAIAVM